MLNPAHRLNKVNGVVIVFLYARGNGKDIGVKNNVFGWKAHFIDQHAVSAFTYFFFACTGIGLAFFIKSHDYRSRAIAFDQFGLFFERLHPLFHTDGVDYCLALHAAQASLYHFPFGGVDHHWHFGDIGFARH